MTHPTAEHPPIEDEQQNVLSRRTFIRGALGLVGLGLIGGSEAPHADDVLPLGIFDVQLPDVAIQEVKQGSYQPLERSRLTALFQYLERNNGDEQSRVTAVKNSLRLTINKGTGALGTAFQIDESGIYLTAKHCTSEEKTPNQHTGHPFTVVNPLTGEQNLVQNFLLHPSADLAVIHAPNDRPAKPVSNLQLDFSNIVDDQQLWMISQYPGFRNGVIDHLYRHQSSGSASLQVRYPSLLSGGPAQLHMSTEAQLAVIGMIPYGGTSGGPIVDAKGVVRGVESGTYPESARNISEYQGSKITPLSFALSLPTN